MNILIALHIGFLLDLTLGDPPRIPHIVVAMGKTIEWCERALRRALPAQRIGELLGGSVLAAAVVTLWTGIGFSAVSVAERAHPLLALALESFVCWQILATKSLAGAGARVHAALAENDIPAARKAVGMIVGRDTAALSPAGVARAAVETVAENTSDGIVAPMLFFAVGGAPLALAYKAINTMDSMLGYRNEKYRFFGSAAARLDDAANFLPARLTALLMILAAAVYGTGRGFDWRRALRVYRRDRNAHSSPNAGHPESACAGALGIQLGGDSSYGGRLVRKPALGDASRAVAAADILRANCLLYGCAVLSFFLCCGVRIAAGSAPWN
jgi:adenosylcobinamide-phosphate synthase